MAMIKVPNSMLQRVDSALADLGYNELPYRVIREIRRKRDKVEWALTEGNKVIADIKKAALPAGRTIEELTSEMKAVEIFGQAYNHVISLLKEHDKAEVELDFGDPIDIGQLAEKVRDGIMLRCDDSMKQLEQYGLIKD